MIHDVLGGYGYQLNFLIDLGLSLLAGFLIGAERESRGKPAGISTHCGHYDVYVHFITGRSKLDFTDCCSDSDRDRLSWGRDDIEK
ncbi:MAG: MgtC/SapB family protein [Nitrososphaeraceae archaeon]